MQKTDRRFELETQSVSKLITKYAVPSIIAMLVGALYNIVDQIFIGNKIGELGNAATNVAFPLSIICISAALLFGIGGASAFNLSMGEKKTQKALSYVGNALVMLFVFGVLICFITLIFLTPLLKFFGATSDVLGYAKEYTWVSALGFPFLVFATGGSHLIRADGSPKFAMISNLIGALINTILDPIFIFGMDMGMKGAALATIIGQIASFVIVAIYFTKFKTARLEKQHLNIKSKTVGRLFALGSTPALNQLAMMVIQIVMNNSLVYYGARSAYGETVALASAGIINKVASIFFAIIIGISQGMQPILSYNYGAKKYSRVKKAYFVSTIYSFSVAICAFLLFQLIPKQIILLFGKGTPEYINFSAKYFRVFMFFTFINFVQPMTSTYFTAIGKPKRGIFLSLTRQILFLLPLIVLMPIYLGIDGILYSGPIADFLAATVSITFILFEFKNMAKLQNEQNQILQSELALTQSNVAQAFTTIAENKTDVV